MGLNDLHSLLFYCELTAKSKKDICDIFNSMQNCMISHFSSPALCSGTGPSVKVVQKKIFLENFLCTRHSTKVLIIVSLTANQEA